MLNATCIFTPDAAFREQLNALGQVVITQGFIASDADGNTVLLGSRRLGYLGGLFRRQAAARAAGDLDRRAGHVQRQPALDAERAPAARAALR